MSDTDHVLNMIDGALADWTSDDAMRWSPAPETVAAPAPWPPDAANLDSPRAAFHRDVLREILLHGDVFVSVGSRGDVAVVDRGMLRPTPTALEAFRRIGTSMYQAFEELGRSTAASLRPIVEMMTECARMEAARVTTELDARERALRTRQQRNTGPEQRRRPPRRIDAR